jgi:hypothetical protein
MDFPRSFSRRRPASADRDRSVVERLSGSTRTSSTGRASPSSRGRGQGTRLPRSVGGRFSAARASDEADFRPLARESH